jgi:hypothetical protein
VIRRGGRAAVYLCCGILVTGFFALSAAAADFRFDRDTPAFANSTVFEYHEGVARLRSSAEKEKIPRYTRRCFTMCRAVLQFQKFARFDRHGTPLDDKELAQRVRAITRHPAWHDPFPMKERIVMPGYANLRQLSEKRGWVLQKNIGLGWPTYTRVGNWRMFYNHGKKYQEKMHVQLNAALARGELFVAYLSDFPTLHINHAIMVYARKSSSNSKEDRYNSYDPNHPDGPRELVWLTDQQVFNFERDQEFVGGFARVYRVYNRPLQ